MRDRIRGANIVIGFAQRIQGRYAQARAQMERARRNLRDEGTVLSNLSLTVHQQGDQEVTREYGQESLRISQKWATASPKQGP